MNKIPTAVNQSTYRILYYRYKEFFAPVGVLLVCIIVFIFFVIPQFQEVVALQGQINDANQRLNTLNNNIAVVTGLNESVLNSQLQTTFRALPEQKDFAAILEAISNAALQSNVTLGDYNLQIGDVTKTNSVDDANLQLTLNVTGNVQDVIRFIINLKKQLPLSDINNIAISGGSSSLDVTFYAKPVSKITFLASSPIQPLTKQQQELLSKLYPMERQSNTILTPTPTLSVTLSPTAQPTPTTVVVITPTLATTPSQQTTLTPTIPVVTPTVIQIQ